MKPGGRHEATISIFEEAVYSVRSSPIITLLMSVLAFRVPREADQSVSADVKLDGFRYIVGQDDVGSYFVTVFFDEGSVAGLKAYAVESRT